jgi:hypothetical protein
VSARSRTTLLVALVAVITSASAAPAVAAGWSPPQAVGDRAATSVHGAGNRHGSLAFVWKLTSTSFVRLPAQSGFASRVRARIRLPGGRLGRAQTISSTREIVASPQIGVAENGDAWTVWTQAGRHIRIMAAFHPRAKPFGAPFELGRSSHFNDARPQLAVGRFGDVAIAWNAGANIRVVRRAANAQCSPRRPLACFRPAVNLRPGADHTVAIGPLGSAYVVWAATERAPDTVRSRLRMTVIRRSNRRSREHAISPAAASASQPSVAVRGDGTADIAWRASLPTGGEQNEAAPIWAAASGPDALTAPPRQVSLLPAERPVLRGNRQGEAILAWSEYDLTPGSPEGPRIATAVRAAGAKAFGLPATISTGDPVTSTASLAVDAAGTAFLAYSSSAPPPAAAPLGLSRTRPPGGVFSAPLALPAGIEQPLLIAAGAKVVAAGIATDERFSVSEWLGN